MLYLRTLTMRDQREKLKKQFPLSSHQNKKHLRINHPNETKDILQKLQGADE